MEVKIIDKPKTDLDMRFKTYYEVTLTDENLEMFMKYEELIYPFSELTEDMRTQFIFKIHPFTSNKKFQGYPDSPTDSAYYTEIACDYRGLESFKDEIRSLGILPIEDYDQNRGKNTTIIMGYVDINLE